MLVLKCGTSSANSTPFSQETQRARVLGSGRGARFVDHHAKVSDRTTHLLASALGVCCANKSGIDRMQTPFGVGAAKHGRVRARRLTSGAWNHAQVGQGAAVLSRSTRRWIVFTRCVCWRQAFVGVRTTILGALAHRCYVVWEVVQMCTEDDGAQEGQQSRFHRGHGVLLCVSTRAHEKATDSITKKKKSAGWENGGPRSFKDGNDPLRVSGPATTAAPFFRGVFTSPAPASVRIGRCRF